MQSSTNFFPRVHLFSLWSKNVYKHQHVINSYGYKNYSTGRIQHSQFVNAENNVIEEYVIHNRPQKYDNGPKGEPRTSSGEEENKNGNYR